MRVREVIFLNGFSESGETFTKLISDEIVVVESLDKCDWGWWEPVKIPDNKDLKITVKYFPETCEDIYENPLACFHAWQSEIVGKA